MQCNVMYKKYLTCEETELTKSYPIINISDNIITENGEGWDQNKLADYKFIQSSLKSLTGRVLTIIDASIPESKQNKCVKDLIRREFMDEFSHVSGLLNSPVPIPEPGVGMEVVEDKEILGA